MPLRAGFGSWVPLPLFSSSPSPSSSLFFPLPERDARVRVGENKKQPESAEAALEGSSGRREEQDSGS